jgi:AcrR family transcriptional regulator
MAAAGSKGSAKRTLLLDTTQQLMLEEGYAAVSTRRVALKAGIKPPLVHYYFPTTDDLLLAVYERAAQGTHERTMEALTSPRPLEALFNLSKDRALTALGMELIALATHRKVIRDAIIRTAEAERAAQADALAQNLGPALGHAVGGPMGLIVLITGISRMLVMEEVTGVTAGHAESRAIVEWLLDRVLQPGSAAR